MTIMEAAKRIQKLTGCEIKVNTSEENEDKRNYKVSADKIKKIFSKSLERKMRR